jgi:hypothetical protein
MNNVDQVSFFFYFTIFFKIVSPFHVASEALLTSPLVENSRDKISEHNFLFLTRVKNNYALFQ